MRKVASTTRVPAGQSAKGANSIIAHPAFPLVVALWFAALLGLGSLVMPVALFEGLLTNSGIASIVAAAAPPLGVTARIAIALFGAMVGAAFGFILAHKIKPVAPRQARLRSFGAAGKATRQPLNAHEELGAEGFDGVASFATARRRALAGQEEESKSDFLQVAPLPGEDDRYGFAFPQKAAAEEPGAGVQYDPVLSTRKRTEVDDSVELLDLGDCMEVEFADLDLGEIPQQAEMPDQEGELTRPQFFMQREFTEPLPFSPPSMARRPTEMADPQGIDAEAELVAEVASPILAEQAIVEEPNMLPAAPGLDAVNETSIEEVGLVQLVQRLGTTLEKHREWSALRKELLVSAPRFPHAIVTEAFDMAAPDEAAQAMANFFATPAESLEELTGEAEADPIEPTAQRQEFIPAPPVHLPVVAQHLRPFAGLGRIDEADEETCDDDEQIARLAATFSLPFNRVPEKPASVTASVPGTDPVFDVDAGPDHQPEELLCTDEADADIESYSSLFGAKNPFRDQGTGFVRVEEPEAVSTQAAVVFPQEAVLAQSGLAQSGPARPFDRPVAAIPVDAADAPIVSARLVTSSDENERVLREALMNLQRIGKSA